MMNVTIKQGADQLQLNTFPYRLKSDVDLSGLEANVNILVSGRDGGTHTHSAIGTRDIAIEGMIDTYNQSPQWLQERKNRLYQFTNPKEPIEIHFEKGGVSFYANAIPSSFPTFQVLKQGKFQPFLLEYICADPFLYKNKKVVTFADVTPTFSFPRIFNDTVMGEKEGTLYKTIVNEGVMSAPVDIYIKALGAVTNPTVLNVVTQEQMKLNATLQAGDLVTISTGRKKEVSLTRNNKKTVFYYALDLNSKFLQLASGNNIIRFSAEQNQNNMQVEVHYQEKMGGF